MTKKRTDRPKRISLNQQRNTLTFDNRDTNYVYRVFNDVDNRLQKAEIAGYEYVRDDEQLGDPTADSASPLTSVVSKPVGGGKTGVLMRIKKEWYQEDQKEKQRSLDELESSLLKKADEDGHYGKLKISRGT